MKGMQGVSDWSLKKGGLWSGWSVVSVVSVVSQQLSNCATIGYCCCCYSHYKFYDCSVLYISILYISTTSIDSTTTTTVTISSCFYYDHYYWN